MEINYARISVKSAEGLPTIPPSASHDNGDWSPTDIYEYEPYIDSTTGSLYTRIGSAITLLSSSDIEIEQQVQTVVSAAVVGLLNDLGNIAAESLVVLQTAQSSELLTFTDIEGFSISLPAGKSLKIEGVLLFTVANANRGLKLNLNIANAAGGSLQGAANTYVALSAFAAGGGLENGRSFNLNASATANYSLTTNSSGEGENVARISGLFKNNAAAAAIFKLQFAAEQTNAAVTAVVGSCLRYSIF
jgi:hypothetical protein